MVGCMSAHTSSGEAVRSVSPIRSLNIHLKTRGLHSIVMQLQVIGICKSACIGEDPVQDVCCDGARQGGEPGGQLHPQPRLLPAQRHLAQQ